MHCVLSSRVGRPSKTKKCKPLLVDLRDHAAFLWRRTRLPSFRIDLVCGLNVSCVPVVLAVGIGSCRSIPVLLEHSSNLNGISVSHHGSLFPLFVYSLRLEAVPSHLPATFSLIEISSMFQDLTLLLQLQQGLSHVQITMLSLRTSQCLFWWATSHVVSTPTRRKKVQVKMSGRSPHESASTSKLF
jgi:hypothetical protein